MLPGKKVVIQMSLSTQVVTVSALPSFGRVPERSEGGWVQLQLQIEIDDKGKPYPVSYT